MKHILIIITACLLAFNGIAQKKGSFSQEDVKQFYRTIQGDYKGQLSDSLEVTLHFTPIWEREDDPFHWLYLEAINDETKQIMAQYILEIVPSSDIAFDVVVHGLKSPEVFAGKWGNRNFFDGYNTRIFKGKKKLLFLKTKDFEYQTSWYGSRSLNCFPSGDKVHFKFVQEDERLYIKRPPQKSTHSIGITFFKEPID